MTSYGSLPSDPMSVDADSPVTRWIRWRARSAGKALAGIQIGDQTPSAFVPEQVLVDPSDSELINDLIERFGAQVLPTPANPPRPPELGF